MVNHLTNKKTILIKKCHLWEVKDTGMDWLVGLARVPWQQNERNLNTIVSHDKLMSKPYVNDNYENNERRSN